MTSEKQKRERRLTLRQLTRRETSLLAVLASGYPREPVALPEPVGKVIKGK